MRRSMLLLLLAATPARAEIAIGESVEWLCSRAEVVAVGHLTQVDGPPAGQDLGKNEALI